MRATYRALGIFATRLNYTVETMSGVGGVHITNESTVFKIRIGKAQSLEDKVICFSHELGHALDITHTPFTLEEKANMPSNRVSKETYMREVVAWDKACSLLCDMGCLPYVVKRFDVFKMEGLNSYIRTMGT